jgi:heme O synthase-like polyprenyltransferase
MIPWLAGVLGWTYAVAAAAGGALLGGRILSAMRAPSRAADRRVFAASLVHLAVVFGAMTVELALR